MTIQQLIEALRAAAAAGDGKAAAFLLSGIGANLQSKATPRFDTGLREVLTPVS